MRPFIDGKTSEDKLNIKASLEKEAEAMLKADEVMFC